MGRGNATHTIARLRARDGDNCWLCGLIINWAVPPASTTDSATRDHVIPRIHGGTNALSNQRLAHKICNHRRGHDRRVYGNAPRSPRPEIAPDIQGDGLRKQGRAR